MRQPLTFEESIGPQHDVTHSGDVAAWSLDRSRSFLYDGASQVEALMLLRDCTIHDASRWSRRFRDVCAAVANAAVESNVPLLFVYGPSAPPFDGSNLDDQHQRYSIPLEWRAPEGPALRFSVALSKVDFEGQERFRRRLVEVSIHLGCDLYFRRGYGDRKGPGWEGIVSNPNGSISDPESELGDHLALTAVGPATVGSTRDLLRLINVQGLGVASIAISALESIAFINLLLWVPRTSTIFQDSLPLGSQSPHIRTSDLGGLRQLLIPDSVAAAGVGEDLVDYPRLKHYRFFASRPMVEGAATSMENRRPIWMAWRTPRVPNAMEYTIKTLRNAVERELVSGSSLRLDFLICRESSEDWLRGRCKVSVSWHDLRRVDVRGSRDDASVSRTKDNIGYWCSRVERHWRTRLSRELHSTWVETEVAWRERWIGRLDTFVSIR